MAIRSSDKAGTERASRIDDPGDDTSLFESHDPRMQALLETAARAAVGDTTILLSGESGTGKNVLARQIHRWSLRYAGPFVVINCTTLPEQLLENELFGHIRGAFTGAVSDRPGRLEAGDAGTVLFDEIADLSPSLQSKFLRFVQEHSFERIGSNRKIILDVRILAASNGNLETEVAAGRFREDLYYRLGVVVLRLPPLRERSQDIIPLATGILRQVARRANRPLLSLSAEAAAALISYRWPGNVRELHNALERAVALARGEAIMLADLPESIREPGYGTCVPAAPGTKLEDFEREYILRALAEGPTFKEAAAKLGINVATLWRKRKRYGIE